MTRISVAELTLKKQIERVTHDMETCARERDAFVLQYDILWRQREALQLEFNRLGSDRHEASTKRKPTT